MKETAHRFTGHTYYERKPSLWSKILMFLRIKKRPIISYNTYDEGWINQKQ